MARWPGVASDDRRRARMAAMSGSTKAGPAGQAIFDTSQRLGKVAEYFIYAVPVFGIALLFISTTAGNHVYWWDQAWVSAGLVIYILTLGFVHSLHLPNLKKMGELMAEMNATPPSPGSGPPPQVAELQ